MSNTIELRVNGTMIETRPMSEMRVSVLQELAKLDSKSEWYEMSKATTILKSCLVKTSDWETFENMSVNEFTEVLSEWMELQSGTTLL